MTVSMYSLLLLVLLLLVVVFPPDVVFGFGRGAPGDVDKTRDAVCNEMYPLHYNLSFQDPDSNPFYIDIEEQRDGTAVKVILRVSDGSEDALIMGFLVQGRDREGRIVGTFDTTATENITLTCENTTVSQYKKQWKKEIELLWLPPQDFVGEVFFRAVILKNISEFWKVDATSHPYVDTRVCDKASGCFRCPKNNCFVKWTPTEGRIGFEVEARGEFVYENAYVAIGLSEDNSMGDDSVTQCYISQHNGEEVVRMSWNKGQSNQLLREPFKSIVPGSSKVHYKDNTLRCSFQKYLRPGNEDPNFDSSPPEKVFYAGLKEYFLLVAVGQVLDENGNLEMHMDRFISSGPINFTAVNRAHRASVVPYRATLVRVHGTMMVIAWMLLASFSSLMPRYFKKKLPGIKIFQRPFWFALHQGLMAVVVGLTVISLIIIFTHVGGYAQISENPGSSHPPLGIVVTILVLLNPIMAQFRCDTGSKNRWIFDLLHFVVGETAIVLSVATIFLSVSIKKAGLPYWLNWFLAAHVCWHAVAQLLLAAHDRHVTSLSKAAPGEDLLRKHEMEVEVPRSKSSFASPKIPILILAVYAFGSVTATLVTTSVICWA